MNTHMVCSCGAELAVVVDDSNLQDTAVLMTEAWLAAHDKHRK